jgi:hypothetical protein
MVEIDAIPGKQRPHRRPEGSLIEGSKHERSQHRIAASTACVNSAPPVNFSHSGCDSVQLSSLEIETWEQPNVPYDPVQQAFADEEHLRLLSIGYFISAAITAFFSLFGLFYAAMGAFVGRAASKAATSAANFDSAKVVPEYVGWIFGAIGIAIFCAAITLAALKLRAGFCLRNRKSRTFCLVVAAFTCLGIPYGTMLGVFTFIILERPTVSRMFAANANAAALAPRV